MKFMMLVCVDPTRVETDEAASEPASQPAETAEAAAEASGDDGSFPWLDDVVARGIRLDGDQLRPPEEAKTVQNRDGQILVTDGPFAETKEVICGYDILECADIDEAVRVAAAHPVAAFGKIEVRAVLR